MLAEVFLAIFLAWFSRYVITTYLKRRNMPPGPIPYPFIGNIPQLMCDPAKPFAKLAEKYGDIYSVSFANIEAVVLSTDALIREAKLERKDDIVGRSPESVYPVGEILEGDVFSSDYSPKYRFRRRVLVSGLHIIGSGIEIVSKRAKNAVDIAIEEINSKQGHAFSPQKLFDLAIIVQLWDWLTSTNLTLDDPIIKDIAEFGNILLNQAALSPMYQMLPFLMYLPTRFVREIERAKIIRKELFSPALKEHMETYNQSDIRDLTDSFISAYEKEIAKETGKDIGSDKDIPGLMVDVVIGGYNTTATTLTWLLLYMVLNPNIQEKVYKELDVVVGRDRLPCWNDAEKMPYLQAVLCEVERASGMISMVGANAIRDTTISGYHIKKGTFIALNLYKLHHDEKIWPEAEKFKPERFLDSGGNFVGWNKVYGFFPFGLGRRECPGKSLAKIMMFTFASTLIHRYKFELPEGADIPSTEPSPGAVNLRPYDYDIVAKERTGVQN